MKVLLLGSGGIRIGQAGEFDYSGSQAIKALKGEGAFVILVNPNIATVQTDAQMADRVYLQPLTVETVRQVLERERPSGILLGFGGQTALNLGLELEEKGLLAAFGVRVLGTQIESIRIAEDRALFKQALEQIGIKTARSFAVSTPEEACKAAQALGYPIMMRCAFSLGGLGSGKMFSSDSVRLKCKEALRLVPQVLIEEYLEGWKEVEYEVIRDRSGNALSVCNMENFDPMGIHTGESIVVAPSQTLNNDEYHSLREIAIRIAHHLDIVGECNVQFALNPKDSDYRVVELNPRLSRSSALASKATGYPIAFVAALLAMGKQLHALRNAVTGSTCAFFEPALDYVVVKMPRWDTHKLKAADRHIGTEMKSIGEVMAIGRSFPEALQKAVRMLCIGANGVTDSPHRIEEPLEEVARATDTRLFALVEALRRGHSVEELARLSSIDPWYLHHLAHLVDLDRRLGEDLLAAKRAGFSDATIARRLGTSEEAVRIMRLKQGIRPYIKQIDTLAGEAAAETNYLYLTYNASEDDVLPSTEPPVMVLGSGPYCIGSSVEFDWCAVNAARFLRERSLPTLIVNSNPETVSTDFDESDRLYFEELTLERVRDIADFEQPRGIVVSVGGQVANTLAIPLDAAGYPLLGTTATSIDKAEDRQKFSTLLGQLGIDQPDWEEVTTVERAQRFAERVGFPVLVRPSYVLSGAAMNVVTNPSELAQYLAEAVRVSPKHPVVISEFISDAKELEIDGVAQGGEVVILALSEHVENAGVHSGDATLVLPPQRLYMETIRKAKQIARHIANALDISGPFNIQFIAKNNRLRVIECNVRASRSFPFVSKVINHNLIRIAIAVMLGEVVPRVYNTLDLNHVGVKSPQFSYNRLKGSNPVAHVEMASTGEVACLGDSFLEAFYNSWLATEQKVDAKRLLVCIGGDYKVRLLEALRQLEALGWELYATDETQSFLAKCGVGARFVYKASDLCEPSVTSLIIDHRVSLIINIPRKAANTTANTDGYRIRRLAIDHGIPLITNLQLAETFLTSLAAPKTESKIKSWQEFAHAG